MFTNQYVEVITELITMNVKLIDSIAGKFIYSSIIFMKLIYFFTCRKPVANHIWVMFPGKCFSYIGDKNSKDAIIIEEIVTV